MSDPIGQRSFLIRHPEPGAPALDIQPHPGYVPRDPFQQCDVYRVRVFPGRTPNDPGEEPFRIVATRGQLTAGSVVEFRIEAEGVSFDGSDRIATRFPIVGGLRTVAIYGQPLDPKTLRPIQVTLSRDPHTLGLRASRPCILQAAIAYTTSYRIWHWCYTKPEAGEALFYGSILVRWRGSQARYDMPPSAWEGENSPDRAVFARVTSRVVISGRNRFELPDAWPDSATYTEFPGYDPLPDKRRYAEEERVHHVWYVNQKANVTQERFSIPREKPYDGMGYADWVPALTLSWETPSAEWAQAFLDAERSVASIRADALLYYPTVVEEG